MTGLRIDELTGVTADDVAKLADAGIVTARALLAAADTAPHRNKLADRVGIGRDLIRTWFNHCNVMRINGVGPKFAALLELSGVDSPRRLATQTAEKLAAKMNEVNGERNLARTTPSVRTVDLWIDEATAISAV